MDVVVPFRGAPAELLELLERLGTLRLRDGDSLVVVDNTPRPAGGALADPRVLGAPERATAGYARNRGAARGEADWLVFIDADTAPVADLLDRYFDPAPAAATALLAGGVLDEQVPERGPVVPRYLHVHRAMSQDNTFSFGEWGYPMSANVACRREAYSAVGGFREDIRAAEDADLTYRLKANGWTVERREAASVVHRSRQTVGDLVGQKLRWGSGAAWLSGEYPGAFAARRLPGLTWWGMRTAARGLAGAARSRDRDAALVAVLEPLEVLAYEVGRRLPNGRPLPDRLPWRWLS